MYRKTKQWDELHPDAIKYLEARGLTPIIDYIKERMTLAWKLHDEGFNGIKYDGDDLSNVCTFAVDMFDREAFGAYNALLAVCDDTTIHRHIYDWGHYSVFC